MTSPALTDDRADRAAVDWRLVWHDEFDGPAGAPPDPSAWGYELGDGSANGIPGWGNQSPSATPTAPRTPRMTAAATS